MEKVLEGHTIYMVLPRMAKVLEGHTFARDAFTISENEWTKCNKNTVLVICGDALYVDSRFNTKNVLFLPDWAIIEHVYKHRRLYAIAMLT